MSFDITSAYEALFPHFQKRIHRQEPLAQHSSFGVGGPANLWISIETRQELSVVVSLCVQHHWPLLVVGAGSNILYADAGVRGIVARIAFHSYRIEELLDGSATVIAEAGVHWTQLLHDLVPLGWGGLEFGVGIPGTLGGGIVSNAGAQKQDLGQALEWIEVLDARGCDCDCEEEEHLTVPLVRRYEHDEVDLGYRHSRFRLQRYTHVDESGRLVFPLRHGIEPPEIVLTLGLHLSHQEPKVLCALLDAQKQYRKSADPAHRHTGSIFKDPPGVTAQALIERAGLRGKTHGKVAISEHNANYIVNHGGRCADDIAALIVEAHQQVLQQFGIHLALNVDLLGEWAASSPSAMACIEAEKPR
jgi:UDP-N-acetylmuramate dehydrogenase